MGQTWCLIECRQLLTSLLLRRYVHHDRQFGPVKSWIMHTPHWFFIPQLVSYFPDHWRFDG